MIDLLVCSQGIGGGVDEGTREWSGPSCVVVDLVFFWLTQWPDLTQWLEAMHRAERNTYQGHSKFSLQPQWVDPDLLYIFSSAHRFRALVIEQVPDPVILTGCLTRYPPGKFCSPLCSHTENYIIINSLQLVQIMEYYYIFSFVHRCPEPVTKRVPDTVILTGRLTRYPPGPVPGVPGARVWDPAFVTIETLCGRRGDDVRRDQVTQARYA